MKRKRTSKVIGASEAFCLNLQLQTHLVKDAHVSIYFVFAICLICSSEATAQPPCWVLLIGPGPKYKGIPGVNARGSWNQTAWSLQRAICYTMKQDLETVLYKPLCHRGFTVSYAVYPAGGAWLLTLSLPLQSPFTWPSLQYPLFKLSQLVCLQGTWFYTIFYDTCNAWYMVLRPSSHLISSRLCPSTAGCSPPSMSSIFVCLLPS